MGGDKVHEYCLAYPGAVALIVRRTRKAITHSIIPMMRNKTRGHAKYRSSLSAFVYSNGSMIILAGLGNEEDIQRLRSIGERGGVGFIWIEEGTEVTERQFNELLGRLRDPFVPWRQIFITTNPGPPTHWINQRLILKGEAKVYYSNARMNPAHPVDYFESLESMTGVLYERLVLGKWAAAEGLVFDSYGEHNLIDKLPKGWEKWETFGSVDFGYDNPFVFQWWARDHDNRFYRIRELYKTHLLVIDAAKIIKEYGVPQTIFADHDKEDRMTLAKEGIRTRPARKAVLPGIESVNEGLRKDATERPKIFFLRDALIEADSRLKRSHKPTCTEDEILAYQWRNRKSDDLVLDEPLKENDHGCDATRYLIHSMKKPKARRLGVAA